MIAWLIFTIREGYAYKTIEEILCARILLIASRISLSILCLNLIFVRLRNGIATVPMETSVFKFMYLDQFPYFFLIYFLSFVSRILVESPFSNLVTKLFAGGVKPNIENKKTEQTLEVVESTMPTYDEQQAENSTQRSEV